MVLQTRAVADVNFSLTRQPFSSADSFSVPLLIAGGTNILERVYTFNSASDAEDAGFSTSSAVYNWLSTYFAQTSKLGKKPSVAKVGMKANSNQNCKQSVSFNADATAGNFTITILGETTGNIAYNAAAADVKTAIDALTTVSTVSVTLNSGATDAGDAEGFTIEFSGDANTDFAPVTVNIGSLTSVSSVIVTKTQLGVAAENYAAAFSAIKAVDNNFYFVALDSKPSVIADIDTLYASIEADYKQLWLESENVNIKNGTTTNIASSLKALSLNRTLVLAHYVSGEYAVAAELGATIPDFYGAVNPAYYPLSMITADDYTSTNRTNIITNGANRLERLGNVTCIVPVNSGVSAANLALIMASGQFSELIWIKDYLETVVSEAVVNLLISVTKIPFTIQGFRQIQSIIAATMQNEGVAKGLLAEDSIIITMPDFATYDPTKKAQRWLDGVDADGTLQGAISKITISGSLSV